MADATAAPTCSGCKHHSGGPLGPDARRECRANPPAFGREAHSPLYAPHPVFVGMWPLTLPADGCGGFEATSAEAPATLPATDGATPPPAGATPAPMANKATTTTKKKG